MSFTPFHGITNIKAQRQGCYDQGYVKGNPDMNITVILHMNPHDSLTINNEHLTINITIKNTFIRLSFSFFFINTLISTKPSTGILKQYT